jgi:hypothetical protein
MDREEGRQMLNEDDEGEGYIRRAPADDVEGHITPDDGEGIRMGKGLTDEDKDEGEGWQR